MNFDQGIRRFDASVKNALSILDKNEYVSAALTIFLILYAAIAAPQLPEYIAKLFGNPLFKLLIIFLIAYSANKNPTVSIVAAIGLMVSIHTLNRINLNKGLTRMMATSGETRVPMHLSETRMPHAGEEAHMTEGFRQDVVPEESLSELDAEAVAVAEEVDAGCDRKANFRNSFYPQYVNMKPDEYTARYTG